MIRTIIYLQHQLRRLFTFRPAHPTRLTPKPLMFYLDRSDWSPRYDGDSFFTVNVKTWCVLSSPPLNSPSGSGDADATRPLVRGRSSHPAAYYEIDVRRGRSVATVRRRYSEFCWLRDQTLRTGDRLYSSGESRPHGGIGGGERTGILPPRTCFPNPCVGHDPFDEKFLTDRRDALATFLEKLLKSDPKCAQRPEIAAFLGL